MTDGPDVDLRRNDAEQQYEALIDGQLAGLATFHVHGDRVVFPHTEVYPRWEGMGVGSRLAKFALDDVVATGRSIVPDCPFIAAYAKDHDEYDGHVATT